MEEALVDVLRHPSVRGVKTEGLALEQAGPVLREAVFHTVDGHPVGDFGHPEGCRQLFVGQRLPLV